MNLLASSFSRGRRLLLLALLSTTGPLLSACQDNSPLVSPADPAVEERQIQRYLADKGITNAQRQSSGLYYVPLTTNPAGVQATAGKTVEVAYTGQLLDGTVFDATSRQPDNKPFPFTLGRGQVIPGWDEGIALMRKGEKSILLIPSALGYGTRGAGGGAIPANAVLRFDVELVGVN